MGGSRVALLLVLGGCLTSGCVGMPEKSLFGGNRVNTAAANQLFYSDFEEFSDEKLFELLDPEEKVSTGEGFASSSNATRTQLLSKAFWQANQSGEARRAQIQDRLIAASNQRCNLYMTYLKRVSTYENGIFGTLTTILGGAGAIVTGENSARLLSGLAGISSGTRAELNQAVFESVATSVINPGIEKTRSEFLKEMLAKRGTPGTPAIPAVSPKPAVPAVPKTAAAPLADYTVEGAIADAIKYHGFCSMDTGISFAQKSLQSYDDLGMGRFEKAVDKFEALYKKLHP